MASDCLKQVRIKVRARGDMTMGDAENGTRDAPTALPMVMAMVMGTAVTSTAADTTSTATLEPMARNKNGMRKWTCEALASVMVPGDWRSHMEGTTQ